MMFRVDQRGTIFRDVSAIDEHGNTVNDCTRSNFDYFEAGGTGTLKVTQSANGSFIPDCRGTELSSEAYSWKFRFNEYLGTSSAYETMFEVKCDFTKARTLESDTTSKTDKPADKFTALTESALSVSLDVIDPASNLPVTVATLGQQVRLQLKLNNVEDFGVNAISPFNCSAGTLDHRHNVIFTDEHGCSPRDAQIVFSNNDVTTWRSEIFETFAFSGYKKLYFRCQYHVCFTEDQYYCRDVSTADIQTEIHDNSNRKQLELAVYMCRLSKETSRHLYRRSLSATHGDDKIQEMLATLDIESPE
ncbi:uncharacterized protein [Haliotis asinina]|uniref:uncharacterized protein n=1 Tax=Haliotis asinina TaxID=109174 RepID=UPI00353186C2